MRIWKKLVGKMSDKKGSPTTPPVEHNMSDPQVASNLKNNANSIHRRMSRGAEYIYRTIKTHSAWGNKQLWGSREKGRNKPSDSGKKHGK